MWRIKWENGNYVETGATHGITGITLCWLWGEGPRIVHSNLAHPETIPKTYSAFLFFEELLKTC